jgi:hypothetical protein
VRPPFNHGARVPVSAAASVCRNHHHPPATLLAFLRHPFQLRQHNAFHRINLQGAHYDRSRGDSERHGADRVKVKFKIARRQTMAEMRCRSGAVARPLAALSGSIGFHHRNLTRSARLGDSQNDSQPSSKLAGSRRCHLHTGVHLRRGLNGKRKCNLPAPSFATLLNALS